MCTSSGKGPVFSPTDFIALHALNQTIFLYIAAHLAHSTVYKPPFLGMELIIILLSGSELRAAYESVPYRKHELYKTSLNLRLAWDNS